MNWLFGSHDHVPQLEDYSPEMQTWLLKQGVTNMTELEVVKRAAMARLPETTAKEMRAVKMRVALEVIHSWLVCSAITTPEDMVQSFQEMELDWKDK